MNCTMPSSSDGALEGTRSLAPMVCTFDGTFSLLISAPGTGDTPTTSMVCKVSCADATPGNTAQVKRSALLSALSLVKTSPNSLRRRYLRLPSASEPQTALLRPNSLLLTQILLVGVLNRRNRDFSRRSRDFSKKTKDIFPDIEKHTDYRGLKPISIAIRIAATVAPDAESVRLMRASHTGLQLMTTVLLVDDHPIVVAACRSLLEISGITTGFEASDAATGYEVFLQHEPDVVVIDLRLKDQD